MEGFEAGERERERERLVLPEEWRRKGGQEVRRETDRETGGRGIEEVKRFVIQSYI